MKFIGDKISRAKAMAAIGLVAGAISMAPGLTNDAYAAGQTTVSDYTYQQTEQERIAHQKWLKKNFVEKTIQVPADPTMPQSVINKLQAAGVKIPMKTVKVLRPTKEHQERLNRQFEEMEQSNLRHRVNQLEQNQKRMGFANSLRVDNPNSEYYVPNYHQKARTSNSRINGNNIKINTINDGRDTRY